MLALAWPFFGEGVGMGEKAVDVLVVGGGVVGLSIAWYCLKEGLTVRLLDRDAPGRNTSWAGFGVLPGRIAELAERPYGKLLAASGALHQALALQLLEETGIDNGFHHCGELRVCVSDSFKERFHAKIERYAKGGVVCQPTSDKVLREMEPALSPEVMDGYHLPQTAQIRNPRHLKALRAGVTMRGGLLNFGEEVVRFQLEDNRVTGVLTQSHHYHAKNVVVAAGAWSGGILESIGLKLATKPVKGQALILEPGPIFRHVIASDGLLMIPRQDGKLVIGSTMEHEGFNMDATPQGIEELLERAVAVCPQLAGLQPTHAWAGLRPASRDRIPHIGPIPQFPGLWVAAGHYKLGILLSSATGQMMSLLLAGKPSPISPEPFRPNRPTRRGGKKPVINTDAADIHLQEQ